MPSATMELKVWVDGIQRVVSGATYDTTCQDVVIALAYAMNRTGRFSLIEKWRDKDRPLTPAECPLQVLQKLGEFAGEVRFVLHTAESDGGKTCSQDGLKGERPVFPHKFPPPCLLGLARDANVKRSLTFSGAHNHSQESPRREWQDASAPTSKIRKTHQGSVPNGDIKQPARSAGTSHPARKLLPGQQVGSGGGGGGGGSGEHPVPPPRRHFSPAHTPTSDNLRNRASPSVPLSSISDHRTNSKTQTPLAPPRSHTVSTSPSHPDSASASHHAVANPQAQVPPAFQTSSLPLAPPRSHPVPSSIVSSASHSVAHPQAQASNTRSQGLPAPQPSSHPQAHPRLHPILHPQPLGPGQAQGLGIRPPSKTPSPQPLPPHVSPTPPPPPPASPRIQHSVLQPSPEQGTAFVALETTLTLASSDHSRQASLEIEEYDLERNFPDLHRDSGRSERPSVSLEYRLEDGLGSGSGSGGQLEGEHAKLMRLVNMQQERLKTQESQISLINTDITTLEEKEKEYEEKLHVIMEELLLYENHQHDLEPQLDDLEKVEWDNVIDVEKKCEVDLTLKIASLKAQILEHEHKVEDARNKETELLTELQKEEEQIAQEKERLEAEETQAREVENKTKEEISQIQAQCSEVQTEGDECEASLSGVDSELKSVETDLGEKELEIQVLEAELKNEEDLATQPVSKADPTMLDSGETIIKILEGRLSPPPPEAAAASSKVVESPAAPAFLAALTAKNQSGVWV